MWWYCCEKIDFLYYTIGTGRVKRYGIAENEWYNASSRIKIKIQQNRDFSKTQFFDTPDNSNLN